LDTPLRLFVRDEICGWLIQRNRPVTIDQGFRQAVNVSIDAVVNRAEAMACKVDREQVCLSNKFTFQFILQLLGWNDHITGTSNCNEHYLCRNEPCTTDKNGRTLLSVVLVLCTVRFDFYVQYR
jgi:transformation/transcription domain-associated protein